MQRWEYRYLGWTRFPEPMPSLDVEQFFTLEPTELEAARSPRLPLHQLAVAVHIDFVKMTGTTLRSLHVVPAAVLEHVGLQLGSPPVHIATIRSLYSKRRTLFDHQAAAVKALDFAALPAGAKSGLTAYLRREALAVFDADELLRLARV